MAASNVASKNGEMVQTHSLSIEQINKKLKKLSIRIACWSPADQKALIKVRNPAALGREQWRKVIQDTFANTVTLLGASETVIYVLPAGISAGRVQAVTGHTAPAKDMFADFEGKALMPVSSLSDLPEIKLLQQLDSAEKASGIYYERFVNPPQVASAYHFRVEYAPSLQAMVPIAEEGSTQQGLEGFPRVGGVLEFIQSQPEGKWLQVRGKSGVLYLTTAEANAPLFAIQQGNSGEVSISMRSTLPNGTPFSYAIAQTGNTFTATTNLVSNKGHITLLDFATLGEKP